MKYIKKCSFLVLNDFIPSLRGIWMILLAEFLFALAAVFVKLVTTVSKIPPIEATFFRFSIGFIIAGFALYKSKQSFKPVKPIYVYTRAILNTVSLILFFYSVKLTTITNSNMLNMTYPVFIFLISLVFIKSKPKITHFVYVLLSMIGIYFVIKPDFNNVNEGDLMGLLSGITSAGAIISLRFARRYDTSLIILFYLMFIGFLINIFFLIPLFVMLQGKQWVYLILSGLSGFFGQWLLTSGYKFISARYGSIVSSVRIIYAALFGIFIFKEIFTFRLLLGSVLIFISIIGIGYLMKEN